MPFFLLRYSSEARQSLMEETIGEPGGVSAETVHPVVERVRRQIARPIEEKSARQREEYASLIEMQRQVEERLRRELDENRAAQQQAADQASAARNELRQYTDRQRRSARIRGEVMGRRVRAIVSGALAIVFVAGLWSSAPGGWTLPPSNPPEPVRWIARAAVVVFIAGTLASLIFGWHLQRTARRVELWVARRREAKLLERAGLTEDLV